MPIEEFVLLVARRPPECRGDLHPAGLCTSSLAQKQYSSIDPPETHADYAGGEKAQRCQKHPVSTHPEDEFGVFSMPAASLVEIEESPGINAGVTVKQYPDSAPRRTISNIGAGVHVLFPDHGKEERASAVHDGYVGEGPITFIFSKGFDDRKEERMARNGAHSVVGDPSGNGFADPRGKGKQRI